jgi:hypothetical protein
MITNTYSILSGKDFNKKFGNKRLIKFTNFENDKFDFSYQEGLNEDIVEFDPYKLCVGGGLHFCEYDQLSKWIAVHHEGYSENYYYWDVEVPDDAVVVKADTKFKSNKIILKNRQIIKENDDISIKYIAEYPDFFYMMDKPSIDLVITAFEKIFQMDNDPYAYNLSSERYIKFEEFVRIKFPNSVIYQQLFSKLVNISPYYVTIFIDKAYENFYSLEFIDEMKKKAVMLNIQLFNKFNDYSDSVLDEFIQNSPYIIKLFDIPKEQQIIKALFYEPDVYRFVSDIYYNDVINSYAVEMRPLNIKYVPKCSITPFMARGLLDKNPDMLQFIPKNIQEEIFDDVKIIVKFNIKLFRYLSFYDKDICSFVINVDNDYMKYIPEEFIHLAFDDSPTITNTNINDDSSLINDDSSLIINENIEYSVKNELDNIINKFDSYEGLVKKKIYSKEIELAKKEDKKYDDNDDIENNDEDIKHEDDDDVEKDDEKFDDIKSHDNNTYYQEQEKNEEKKRLLETPKEQSDGWFATWFG